MGHQMTKEMAIGGAAIAATWYGRVDCWIEPINGPIRRCLLKSSSEDGSRIVIMIDDGSRRTAEMDTKRVLVNDLVAYQCKCAYQDLINPTPLQTTALAPGHGKRRNPITGRYNGHHCEPAARK